MNVLVLNPGARLLDFALYSGNGSVPLKKGRVADYRGAERCRAALEKAAQACMEGVPAETPDWGWGVRIPFGGTLFTRPVPLDREIIAALETLAPLAPLHLPAIIELLGVLLDEYAAHPAILVFETAFFAALPQREASYALNAELMETRALRRFGHHGLFHQAACAHARRLRKTGNAAAAPRLLSICLDRQPELAAVIRDRPVMVTGGLTPLEGLPGQTTCGELDPGIVISLSDKMKWGPERIDAVLTRESGLLGLTGERTTLDELLTSERYEGSPGREVMKYRLLLACGAGIAAMGGLSHIVFSGRYAGIGETIGPELISKLTAKKQTAPEQIQWHCFRSPLERIVADHAMRTLFALHARETTGPSSRKTSRV